MRLTSILTAAVLAATSMSSTAHAQFGNPATTNTPITTMEIMRTYDGTPDTDRRRLLARLNAVCASNDRYDQRRCDAAWRIIDRAYAQLQAKKARPQTD